MPNSEITANEKTSPLSEATSLMLEAMRALKNKEIGPKEAAAFALLGRSVTDAAREVTNFARSTGFLPADNVFGSRLQAIEPSASDEALERQQLRLADGVHAIEHNPRRRVVADQNSWKNDGEFV